MNDETRDGLSDLPPPLVALLDFWCAKCDGRPMPARNDLLVKELKPWLGHLALIEQVKSNFVFRLVGTGLIPRLGCDATGQEVNDLARDIADHLNAALQQVLIIRAPVAVVRCLSLGEQTVNLSELFLPLSTPDSPIPMVLLGSARLPDQNR